MTETSTAQLAKEGQLYLEKAILDVFWQAYPQKLRLGPAEISKKAGIFRDRGRYDIMNDAIVTGMLVKLNLEDKVERCSPNNSNSKASKASKGAWRLTEQQLRIGPDDVP